MLWDLAVNAEAVDPGTVVELSVVLLDLREIVLDDEVVDTHDGSLGEGGCMPSPGNLGAAVVQELGIDFELGLSALASIECCTSVEGNAAKLQNILVLWRNERENQTYRNTGHPVD